MRNRNLKHLLVLASVFGTSLAWAGEPASVGDITRVQNETLLLNAQVKRAEAQASLSAKTKTNQPSASSSVQAEMLIDPPVVKLVYGKGAQLYATFIFANGVMMDAKVGDALMGGFVVSVLSVERVELVRGKQRYPIGFSATFPTPAAPPAQVGGGMSGSNPFSALPAGLLPPLSK